jgi:CubicO group peptidase (beta-lactamase class C family)
MRIALALLILFCLQNACAVGQVKMPTGKVAAETGERVKDPEWLRFRLEKVRRRFDLPDLGAAIVVGSKVVAASAVGVRKYGTHVSVTQDDPFHLGSITKVMTATLVGMMIDDGVLFWDTNMRQMFPELVKSMPTAYRDVTVLQLLSHTGGFPYGPSMPIEAITASGRTAAQRRYAYVKAAIADLPAAEPGTKTIYSGGGVVVMAYIERKTKKTYEQLMRERLFGPLGMKTAGIADHMASEGGVDAPWGHRQTDGKTIPCEPDHHSPVNGRQPVGGVYCSMADMGRFLAFQLQGAHGHGRLLKPDTFRRLQTAVPGSGFAPGWSVEQPDWARGKTLAHTGSIGIHVAMCWVAPDDNYAICVGTNAAGEPRADEALGEVFRFLAARAHHGDAASDKITLPGKPRPVPVKPDLWLDKLTPVRATVGFGKFQVGKTGEGSRLALDGDVFAHGLGVHAPSEVIYDLRPEYARFVARVGPEERASWRASVIAKVYLDDVLLDATPLLRAGDPPWNIDVAIPARSVSTTKPRQLRLLVTDSGDGINSDWTDWVDAGFVMRKP